MMKDKHPCEKTEIKTREPARCHRHREHDNEIEIERYKSVMMVLETNPFTRPEVRNFGGIHRWALEEEPSHMSIEKSLFDTVWILIAISFCMMNTMVIGPGRRRSCKSETSQEEVENLNHSMGLVGLVGKKSMIPCCDTETSEDIETDTHYERSETE